jgi:hypothetical protein
MHWMEMIRLRTTQGKEKGLTTLLFDSARQVEKEGGLLDARVLVNTSIPGDLALNLIWETDLLERHGSRVGLGIAEILKGFGLVEHSVWSEGVHTSQDAA